MRLHQHAPIYYLAIRKRKYEVRLRRGFPCRGSASCIDRFVQSCHAFAYNLFSDSEENNPEVVVVVLIAWCSTQARMVSNLHIFDILRELLKVKHNM